MIKLVVNFQLKYGGNLLLAPTDKSSYYLPRLAQEESDDISISYRGVESLDIFKHIVHSYMLSYYALQFFECMYDSLYHLLKSLNLGNRVWSLDKEVFYYCIN